MNGKLAALSKDLDGRDMSMVEEQAGQPERPCPNFRLLGKYLARDRAWLSSFKFNVYHDQTKASGKGSGPRQRSAATGKYKIDKISISFYFSRKNITASEPMRIHFPITLFLIPLHLIPSTGQFTIQPSQIPVKLPNMQISVAALVVFWSILLQYSRTSLCLVRSNLTPLPMCSSVDHSWSMVTYRHGNSCSSLTIRPWSNRSTPRYIFSRGRAP